MQIDKEPSYPHEITLYGEQFKPMYDDAPDMGSFTVDTCVPVDVPRGATLEVAMKIAQSELSKWESANADCENPEIVLDRAVVIDQYGAAMQEFCNRRVPEGWFDMRWMTDIPSSEQWPTLEARASELQEQASEEARWDNHETSKRLSSEAAAMLRTVQIAKTLAAMNVPLPDFANFHKLPLEPESPEAAPESPQHPPATARSRPRMR